MNTLSKYTYAYLMALVLMGLVILNTAAKRGYPIPPPFAAAGAPGETTTCGRCHNTGPNPTSAVLKVKMDNNKDLYVPGSVHKIIVTLEESAVARFGFQITILDQNNNAVGTFNLTQPNRTQIQQFGNRTYVNHYQEGFDAVSPGVGEWELEWTAPASDVGPITIYASGVTSNSDDQVTGDNAFVTTNTLTAGSATVSLQEYRDQIASKVYPNPSNGEFKVELSVDRISNLQISLYDMKGLLVRDLFEQKDYQGPFHQSFKTNGIPAGMYLLKVNSSATQTIDRLVIE